MLNFIKKFLNLTYYTSEVDQFLMEFDHKHPKLSASQRREVQKYARIYKLRDNSIPAAPPTSFWEKF